MEIYALNINGELVYFKGEQSAKNFADDFFKHRPIFIYKITYFFHFYILS